MIIHSSAGMAIVTAAYMLAQSVINPGAENRAAQVVDTAPAGIEKSISNDVLAQAEKKQIRKKVIVIGKNSVSVKYMTK